MFRSLLRLLRIGRLPPAERERQLLVADFMWTRQAHPGLGPVPDQLAASQSSEAEEEGWGESEGSVMVLSRLLLCSQPKLAAPFVYRHGPGCVSTKPQVRHRFDT